MGTPVGVVFGVQLASRVGQLAAYAVIAAVLLVTTALLLFGAREGAARDLPVVERVRGSLGESFRSFFVAFAARDFRLAFVSRFLLFASYYMVSGYAFYTLQDYIGTGHVPDGDVAAAGLPQLLSGALAGAVITWFGGYPALFVFGALCAALWCLAPAATLRTDQEAVRSLSSVTGTLRTAVTTPPQIMGNRGTGSCRGRWPATPVGLRKGNEEAGMPRATAVVTSVAASRSNVSGERPAY